MKKTSGEHPLAKWAEAPSLRTALGMSESSPKIHRVDNRTLVRKFGTPTNKITSIRKNTAVHVLDWTPAHLL